jgi:hypothetical protein
VAADFERDVVERLLDDAEAHLKTNLEASAGQVEDQEAHLRAYAVFEDALTAAGCARALGRGDEKVHRYLSLAADAAVRLFSLRGALLTEVGDLDTGKSELFVDTSATNPWTFVQSAYAAVVSGNRSARESLGELEREDFTSEYVVVPPALERYAVALSDVLKGRPRAAQDALEADDVRNGDGLEERFWTAQATALRHVVDGDSDGFRDAMGEVVAAFEALYAGADKRNDPERLLALPILGLEALAREADSSPGS